MGNNVKLDQDKKKLIESYIEEWSALCCIWQHVDLKLYLTFIYILGFKTILKSHILQLSRKISYLIDTSTLGIWYPKNQDVNLLRYCNSNFTRCRIDGKNINESYLFLNGWLIS